MNGLLAGWCKAIAVGCAKPIPNYIGLAIEIPFIAVITGAVGLFGVVPKGVLVLSIFGAGTGSPGILAESSSCKL